ncbi:hypothetical protein ACGFNU_49920 [Spirillospora sp. NPDC048911]
MTLHGELDIASASDLQDALDQAVAAMDLPYIALDSSPLAG